MTKEKAIEIIEERFSWQFVGKRRYEGLTYYYFIDADYLEHKYYCKHLKLIAAVIFKFAIK